MRIDISYKEHPNETSMWSAEVKLKKRIKILFTKKKKGTSVAQKI